jgi:dipeptidyl aminopeptidase/acylaminoacyl peptidase
MLFAAASAAVLLSAGGSALGAPPPVEAFARLPAIDDADISPNGQRLATLTTTAGGQRLVNIAQLDSDKLATLPMGDIKTRSVRFAGDDYVLVHTSLLVDNVDLKHIYQFQRHVVVDANGKVLTRLLNGVDLSQFATSLPVRRIEHGPKPIAVVQGWDVSSAVMTNSADTRLRTRKDTFTPVLFKVDVKSGRGNISERGNADTEWWAVDAGGEARLRYDADQAGSAYSLLGRPKASGTWRPILNSRDPLDIGAALLGYSSADDAVYLLQKQADGYSLVRRLLADGSSQPVPLNGTVRDAGLAWDEYSDAPVAVVTAGEKSQYQWLEPTLGKAYARAAKALKDQQVTLVEWSQDRTKLVLRAETPDKPPVWYLLDTAAGQLSPIGEAYPELKDARLGTTSWITYKARDGLEIPAYLTLPPGAPASGAKLPLVVLVHGGPAARDDYGFDFLTQFLASRGYAVLRPQFRGSGGFGQDFERAGHREWAGKMQTDLVDGINHLAAQGTVDAKRVCVAGGSYGGYATMASLAFQPQAYRCGVSINGVSDLPSLIGEFRRSYDAENSGLTYWRTVLGRESGGEGAGLVAASPARQPGRIAAPLLLIHGRQDTVVPYGQSQLMQQAMTRAGKPVELITLEGDDHHLSTYATRLQVLKAMEAFLAKQLPAA